MNEYGLVANCTGADRRFKRGSRVFVIEMDEAAHARRARISLLNRMGKRVEAWVDTAALWQFRSTALGGEMSRLVDHPRGTMVEMTNLAERLNARR